MQNKVIFPFFLFILVAIYLNGISCGAEESSIVAEHKFSPGMNLQNSGAIIEVQEDNQSAVVFGEAKKPQSMMFFWLKEEQWKGKILRFTVEAKGVDLSKNFVFGLQGKRNGKTAWPAGTGKNGTFDWKKISFTADFTKLGMESAAIRIGLQNTDGKLLIKSLTIEDISSEKKK